MASPARGSIRRQIPALVGVVLAAGILAFGAVAYDAVRRTTIAAADARLEGVATQFATLFGNSFRGILDSARAAAADPAVRAALEGSSPLDSDRVRAALARLGPVQGAVRAVEIRRAGGGVATALGDSTRTDVRAPAAVGGSAADAAVTGLYVVRDTVLVEIGAPVTAGGRTLGRVVQTRRQVSTPEAVRQITGLIGADAGLLLGNGDGSVWTDLVSTVERPAPSELPSTHTRAGVARRTISRPVAGTPLHVAVDLPMSVALAGMRGLVWRFSALAALVVALGALGGRLFSRRITGPLAELSDAAGRVAAGDLRATATGVDRDDETGRLAQAFNVMAESVRRAHDTLEDQVAERTAELQASLEQVRDLQDELVRKERLATLGRLSSSVGHELRNPLGVINNAVYYLERVLTGVPPKVTEYLALLRDQVHTCEKIVSDLLDFARVRPPQKASLSLSALVDDNVSRVSIPPQVRVERRIPASLPPVAADGTQLGQVLVNLITNGVQAMEDAGGVLTLSATTADGLVLLEVGDTGPGVAGDIRAKIFEPLFTTKARGIGLGLSVSRSLAQANGGDLRLIDKPTSGAVFVLELPAAEADE